MTYDDWVKYVEKYICSIKNPAGLFDLHLQWDRMDDAWSPFDKIIDVTAPSITLLRYKKIRSACVYWYDDNSFICDLKSLYNCMDANMIARLWRQEE